MAASAPLKKLIKKFLDRGWYLDRISKHYIYKHPKGGCVTVSSTASNQNAIRRIERDFKTEERKWENDICEPEK